MEHLDRRGPGTRKLGPREREDAPEEQAVETIAARRSLPSTGLLRLEMRDSPHKYYALLGGFPPSPFVPPLDEVPVRLRKSP